MHDIITTLFTRSWLLALAGAGALRVQVKGEPETIYKAGESFYEAPNGEHLISANASQQEPAKFIACFVCDGDKPLLLPIARTQAKGDQ